jgi:hypothetical protein
MSISCPKVNYKLNYRPGIVICPRSKKIVPLEVCENKIRIVAEMPVEEKV